MATAAEKLHILIIQHLEHVGVAEDIVKPLEEKLGQGKGAQGSTLYDLFCSATGESLTPQQQKQQQVQQQQMQQTMTPQQAAQAPPMRVTQGQPQGRMSMQGGPVPNAQGRMSAAGSVAYNAQQAAMMQQQIAPPTKPVIAKEPEQRNPKLDEQLMAASKSGAVDTIPGLINQGAFVNFQDGAGTTPLLAATEADKVDVVKVLLQNGADVNLCRKDGTSPLICAYKGNKKKVLKELTAGAFRTLNSAVHQTGTIGGGMMYDPGEDEGITQMDICQAHDETSKLFALQAHPPKIPDKVAVATRKESMVDLSGPADLSNLRQGGVRLLMQELCHATQPIN